MANDTNSNDYDISSSQTAQDNFDKVASELEAALSRRDTDVKSAMAEYQAEGVSDNYAALEAQWTTAGNDVKSIISAIRQALVDNDDVASRALKAAAAAIPG